MLHFNSFGSTKIVVLKNGDDDDDDNNYNNNNNNNMRLHTPSQGCLNFMNS